jgi:tetratricopeptide (TPR) repeat protein
MPGIMNMKGLNAPHINAIPTIKAVLLRISFDNKDGIFYLLLLPMKNIPFNIKHAVSAFFFVSLLMLASCGGATKKSEVKKKDSTTVSSAVTDQLKKLNDSITAEPRNPELYYHRAQYYLNARQYDQGLNDMQQALNIDSSKAPYYLTLSDLYFATNKTGNSKKALEKCVALDDKNVDAILKLAELYLYVRENNKSIEFINKALRIDKYNSKAYFMKGMNFKDLKDTAKAISSMQTAVEQDQQYYSAYMQLGLLSAAKRNKVAADYYKNAIRIQPKSVEAWYDLAKFYQDIGDWNNAIANYKTLLTFAPDNKNANYNLGAIDITRGKVSDVTIGYFSSAIKIDANYVEAYYGRGLSYKMKGDKKSAILDFQNSLKINPQFEPAQAALSQMH